MGRGEKVFKKLRYNTYRIIKTLSKLFNKDELNYYFFFLINYFLALLTQSIQAKYTNFEFAEKEILQLSQRVSLFMYQDNARFLNANFY